MHGKGFLNTGFSACPGTIGVFVRFFRVFRVQRFFITEILGEPQKFSLAQTVKMVGAMGTQNTFLKVVNGVIKAASAATDTGQARNIVDGSASGQDAKVWLSAAYLKRAVDACKAEMMVQLGADKQPVLIREGNFTAILMPLFVDGKDPFADDDEPIAICLPELAMAA